MTHNTYDADFYAWQSAGSFRSAQKIVPAIIETCAPRSVLDVGCGVGTWLKAFADGGVQDLRGVDGSWVLEQPHFTAAGVIQVADLAHTLDLGRKYDVVTSFEVAEHLLEDAAENFITNLVSHGDVVVFSAAAPFQGGDGHINERWPEYWAAKFRKAGYLCYDNLRSRFWVDEAVEWWYSQNIFMAVKGGHPLIRRLGDPPPVILPLAHPRRYELLAGRYYALQSSFGLSEQSLSPVSPMTLFSGVARIIRDGSGDCIMCGAGEVGIMAARMLRAGGIHVVAFSDKQARELRRNIDGIPVLSLEQALSKGVGTAVIGSLSQATAIAEDVHATCGRLGVAVPRLFPLS